MSDWSVVLGKTAACLAVIGLGWLAKQKRFLTDDVSRALSSLIVEIALPAFIVTQMLESADRKALAESWSLPLFGASMMLLGHGLGRLLAFLGPQTQRPTLAFLVATPNWVYLPLPIASALYGAEGIRTVLLLNVGSLLVLWTVGVWTLQARHKGFFAELLKNAGLWATILGLLLAVYWPEGKRLLGAVRPDGVFELLASILLQAAAMLGGLTIPLSLMVAGAQISVPSSGKNAALWPLLLVLLGRLLLVPACVLALLLFWGSSVLQISGVDQKILLIVASMPAAASCSLFVNRFGGDAALTARAISFSTLLSLASAPFWFACFEKLRD